MTSVGPRVLRGLETATAGVVAGTLGGLPSILHAIVTRRDPVEAVRAAGTLVASEDDAPGRLLAAGLVAHPVVSAAWALVLVPMLARRDRPVLVGACLGLAIGGLDRAIAVRGFPRLAALPLVPQLADHAAYGALVGLVVRHHRGRDPAHR